MLFVRNICCDKHNFIGRKLLSQAFFCHNKRMFVMTKHSFVTTKVCLSQQIFCRDKHVFARQIICRKQKFLSRQKYFVVTKHNFVPTKVVSQQAYFCRNKRCVLSQQKRYLWQLLPMIDIHTVRHHRNAWSAYACPKRKVPSQAPNPDRVGTPRRLAKLGM